MGELFDRHAVLFDGLYYRTDAYGRQPGIDPALISRGLEPPTELERAGMARVTDLDADLLTHKLTAIVEEARDVYMALSITESVITGDMNCGIFTASGDPAAVATGIYFHTMLNNVQLKYAKKYYEPDPTVGLADGDVYFFNDETAGGVHTFDMFTAMPVFWNDIHVAWVTCGGHQGVSGSPVPGGFNAKARNRYEEGLHVQMLRIGDNFRLNQDMLDMLAGEVYGVEFDSDTGALDDKATERRRARIRRDRLARGQYFDEFVAAWSKRRPPDGVIAQYGAWPDPRAPGYDKPFWGFYR